MNLITRACRDLFHKLTKESEEAARARRLERSLAACCVACRDSSPVTQAERDEHDRLVKREMERAGGRQ